MRKHVLVLTLLIVAATGIGGLVSCANQPGMLEGTVSQAQDGQPVAQAKVLVYRLEQYDQVTSLDAYEKGAALHTLTTDENGAFSVSLESGNYLIEVRVEGQAATSQLVEVKGGRSVTINLSLAAPSP